MIIRQMALAAAFFTLAGSVAEAQLGMFSKEQREANIKLMQECLKDAKKLISDEEMKDFETNVARIAIALFNQRSSHLVYWKEEKAKQRFDDMGVL